jgi:hypothetical protein
MCGLRSDLVERGATAWNVDDDLFGGLAGTVE